MGTDAQTETKTCRVPGCERPAKNRGICLPCGGYLCTHSVGGLPTNDRAATIAAARLPSRTTGRNAERPATASAGVAVVTGGRAILHVGDPDADAPDAAGDEHLGRPLADDPRRTEADVTIATASDLAAALMLDHAVEGDTHFVVNPHNGRGVEIPPSGLIYAIRRKYERVHG